MDNTYVSVKKRFEQNEQFTNDMLKCENIIILIKHFQKSFVKCTVVNLHVHV